MVRLTITKDKQFFVDVIVLAERHMFKGRQIYIFISYIEKKNVLFEYCSHEKRQAIVMVLQMASQKNMNQPFY
jgi:hypothetical protein